MSACVDLVRAKAWFPWQLKIGAKLILSRVPVQYRIWHGVSLFRHGAMDEPEYAYRVFRRHFDRSEFAKKDGGFVSLELGPGDSLFSCLTAKALGAAGTWLVDTGAFADGNVEAYRRMANLLHAKGYALTIPSGGLDAILGACGGIYGTEGLKSLKQIPTAGVDWIWSQAVLEHIRRAELLEYMRELRRVIAPDGICSHRVDLRDHIGGALNNLRFAEPVWESTWMANSGFYTNRIQFDDMCEVFDKAGFVVEVLAVDRWDQLPTPRASLAEQFRNKPDDVLRVSGFDVLLRPRG